MAKYIVVLDLPAVATIEVEADSLVEAGVTRSVMATLW